MTNNAAERRVRTVAVGRRNWTFCGSDRGGDREAAMYTLIQTCRLNGVEAANCVGAVDLAKPSSSLMLPRHVDDVWPADGHAACSAEETG